MFAQTSVPDYRLRFTTSYTSSEHQGGGGGGGGRADTARASLAFNGTQSSGNLQSLSNNGHRDDDDDVDEEGGDATRVLRATDLAERMRANLRLLKEDAFARDQLETRVRRRLDEQRAQRREKAERAAAKAAANARVRDEAVQKLLNRGGRGHGGSDSAESARGAGGTVPSLAPEADLAIALQTARGDFTARNRMPTSFAPHAIEVGFFGLPKWVCILSCDVDQFMSGQNMYSVSCLIHVCRFASSSGRHFTMPRYRRRRIIESLRRKSGV